MTRPSSREIIDGIAETLAERIAPAVADQPWPASHLRHIDALLGHLAVRVDEEGTILHEDNADARFVLTEVRRLLDMYELGEVLTHLWRDPDDYPTIESLAEENHSLVAAVERVIALLHDEPERFDPGARTDAHDRIVAYLHRRIEREEPLYGPFDRPLD